MRNHLKHKLARANGMEKEFVDSEIGKSVECSYSPNEENAIDRKTIHAIAEAIEKAGIQVDPVTLAEFRAYHATVEATKENIKNVYKGETV